MGEAQAEKYDDTLLPFLALMRRELHANSSKGDRPGWLSMSKDTALLEIYWHVAKLSAAVKNCDDAAIAEHSADVANMSMMLLDVCGGLTATTPKTGTSASAAAPAVYLSGPMTGQPDLNFPAFHAMTARLRAAGHEVVNPAELNPDPAADWNQCMRRDIAALCTCTTLALMPGWETSQGAQLELHIAHRIGLQIVMAEALTTSNESAL